MTGRDVTVPIGCKTHPRPRSLSRQQPVQSYPLRPHPPNLWTVPIGDGLRSRTHGRQATEVAIAVGALNRMLDLGRPEYVRIA